MAYFRFLVGVAGAGGAVSLQAAYNGGDTIVLADTDPIAVYTPQGATVLALGRGAGTNLLQAPAKLTPAATSELLLRGANGFTDDGVDAATAGGDVTVRAGTGGDGSGINSSANGGAVLINGGGAGTALATATPGAGGRVEVNGAQGGTNIGSTIGGQGGDVSVQAGAGGNAASGIGGVAGVVSIFGGEGGACDVAAPAIAGGAVSIGAGAGADNANVAGGGGVGGAVTITGGEGGFGDVAAPADGGEVIVRGGDGGPGAGDGGDVNINAGAAGGVGAAGAINIGMTVVPAAVNVKATNLIFDAIATTASVANAVVDAGTGQVARSTSLSKYKDNQRPLDFDTSAVYALEPKSYDSNLSADKGKTNMFGLIAEEVAEAFPALAEFGKEGEVAGVKYGLLAVVLLAEIKKLNARITQLEAK